MEMLLITVSLASLAIATGMSVVAWRLVREGRLRSAARVEALETLAFATPAPAPAPVPDDRWDTPAGDGEPMFGGAAEPAPPGRRWLALAAVAGMMALGAGTVYALRPSVADASPHALGATPAPVAAPGARPLELTSLEHSTDEPGYFTVTGLVHNPASASSLRGVVAVVYLFDAQGQYLANARVPVDLASLDPGVESRFSVRIAIQGVVARYRVGFRMPDGTVVPHVDRRAAQPKNEGQVGS
ncbi:MAG: FxLYD domain-containing protein [Vicinamibacterales bacterium]